MMDEVTMRATDEGTSVDLELSKGTYYIQVRDRSKEGFGYSWAKYWFSIKADTSIPDGLHMAEDENIYYYKDGKVDKTFIGYADYDGAWFYIENGKVAVDMNAFVEYDGGLFAVGAGRIISEYSGLMQDPQNSTTGDWYFFANGQAQTQYTGLALYDGHWFYVQAGKFDPAYNGKVIYDGAEFDVVNGEAQVH